MLKKSLWPLISALSVIVLLTTVLVNFRETRRAQDTSRRLKLSPYKQSDAVNFSQLDQDDAFEFKVHSFLLQAYNALERGEIELAASQVKTILVFEPDNYDALSLLGRIYFLRKKYKAAEVVYRDLIKLNGKDSATRNNLGQTLIRQHKYKQAVKELTTAYKLAPSSGLISLNLAGALAQSGNKKLSLVYFKKANTILKDKILTKAHSADLDPIRNDPEFIKLINENQGKVSQHKLSDKLKEIGDLFIDEQNKSITPKRQ